MFPYCFDVVTFCGNFLISDETEVSNSTLNNVVKCSNKVNVQNRWFDIERVDSRYLSYNPQSLIDKGIGFQQIYEI